MRIVLWLGNDANQRALANKIALKYSVVGIVKESRKAKRKVTLKKVFTKLFERIFLSSIDQAWWGLMIYYEKKYPYFPDVKILEVENINSSHAYEFVKDLNPDLILVSGTRLIKERMLSLKPTIGILNLHTGLSPYIKGGPNCTNWCIAKRQFHLIGNTIMWINIGIDTGNILTTEFTPLVGNESLLELHIKVMEHAHELYIKSIEFLSQGKTSNIKQSEIAKGKTYYTKRWNLKEKIYLIKNFRFFNKDIISGKVEELRKDIKIVKI
jgi:methionyl-tRNA formyltransferase